MFSIQELSYFSVTYSILSHSLWKGGELEPRALLTNEVFGRGCFMFPFTCRIKGQVNCAVSNALERFISRASSPQFLVCTCKLHCIDVCRQQRTCTHQTLVSESPRVCNAVTKECVTIAVMFVVDLQQQTQTKHPCLLLIGICAALTIRQGSSAFALTTRQG